MLVMAMIKDAGMLCERTRGRDKREDGDVDGSRVVLGKYQYGYE